ncbi:MAG: sugar ABC transporter ATP-binding protein [Anaerolineae bacterium]|jgi:ribose transport system ATP-binding protein|nr:sugar ABC transporter ATP-binding protein [Anaerolineae bacterium]
MDHDDFILRMEQICKRFPGVQALDNVTFRVARGEIHALVGENGAGKSTLMKILTGAIPRDSGQIILRGQEIEIDSPGRAQQLGISMIHQELALIPYLNVGQNIYLGREPGGPLPGLINWPQLYSQAREQLARLNMDLDPLTAVADLPIAQQQMVEVAKALSFNADIIVMDEPTSALTERETETLFEVMRTLKAQGVTIIFISHRLEEVFEVADRVTVLRDGRLIGVAPISEVSMDDVVRMMVGRELGEMYPKQEVSRQDVVLRVRGLTRGNDLRGVSLELHRGEILGIAGLVGAGRTPLARALFGIDPVERGEIWVDGQPARINSPHAAIRLGLGFVPEDRKEQGLFLGMAVRENITIGILDRFSVLGFPRFRELDRLAESYVRQLDIRTPSLRQRMRNLSGGNQQKVVIARWLTLHPKVLILDEPTRGIDVGAKAEIHALMNRLAGEGVGIIMISSELPEILGISDRILVMRQGQIVGEFSRQEATQDAIMLCAAGGKGNAN